MALIKLGNSFAIDENRIESFEINERAGVLAITSRSGHLLTVGNYRKEKTQMFHDFEIVSKKTGFRMELTKIGKNREDAERTLRNHNFKSFDFEKDYELIDPHAAIRATFPN